MSRYEMKSLHRCQYYKCALFWITSCLECFEIFALHLLIIFWSTKLIQQLGNCILPTKWNTSPICHNCPQDCVRVFLPGKWIGRTSVRFWALRSPELMPMDFSFEELSNTRCIEWTAAFSDNWETASLQLRKRLRQLCLQRCFRLRRSDGTWFA